MLRPLWQSCIIKKTGWCFRKNTELCFNRPRLAFWVAGPPEHPASVISDRKYRNGYPFKPTQLLGALNEILSKLQALHKY